MEISKRLLGLLLVTTSVSFLISFFWAMYDHFGKDMVIALIMLSAGTALLVLGFFLLSENK